MREVRFKYIKLIHKTEFYRFLSFKLYILWEWGFTLDTLFKVSAVWEFLLYICTSILNQTIFSKYFLFFGFYVL